MEHSPQDINTAELIILILDLRKDIEPYMVEEEGDEPSIQLTVGWSHKTGNWGWQSGDNSFTGGAYGFPHWGIVYITSTGDEAELALDLKDQIEELMI
jgi:hypothetical protein